MDDRLIDMRAVAVSDSGFVATEETSQHILLGLGGENIHLQYPGLLRFFPCL